MCVFLQLHRLNGCLKHVLFYLFYMIIQSNIMVEKKNTDKNLYKSITLLCLRW